MSKTERDTRRTDVSIDRQPTRRQSDTRQVSWLHVYVPGCARHAREGWQGGAEREARQPKETGEGPETNPTNGQARAGRMRDLVGMKEEIRSTRVFLSRSLTMTAEAEFSPFNCMP